MSETPDAPCMAYRVLTPRLEIRCYEPSDAQALVDAMADGVQHLLPWLPWGHDEPQTLEQKVALLRSFRAKFDLDQDYIVGAFDRANRAWIVGGTGIHLRQGPGAGEIGYWMRAGQEGRGYATEMAAAMTAVGFRCLRLEKMVITVHVDNAASAAIPRKLGYRLEGTIRRSIPRPGSMMGDRLFFGMLREEFDASPAAAVQVEAFDALRRRLL